MICLTCHAEFQYAQEALHYGVMEYVVKPIDFQKLSEIIHRAVLLQEENRKKKQQESQGCLWESNKQQIETAFWKDVLTGIPSGKRQSGPERNSMKMNSIS